MDASPQPASEPRSPAPGRVGVALAVFMALLALSLAYHDGLVWTKPLSNSMPEGTYRVKGIVEHYDADAGEIQVTEGGVTRMMHWNISAPQTPAWYVVDVEVASNGTVSALSLSRVFLFHG